MLSSESGDTGLFAGPTYLPIKFIAHYKSDYGADDPRGAIDWEKGYNNLKNFGNKTLPIHALKEGEYVIIEK